MVALTPIIIASPSTIPGRDSVLRTPPIWWHAFAGDINAESGSAHTGRFVGATQEIEGAARFLPQDTFLQGTSGRSGRAFDAIGGTLVDDAVYPGTDSYLLSSLDASANVQYEAVEHTEYSTSGLTHSLILLRRGVPAHANPGGYDPDETYTFIELCYGAPEFNIRIAMQYGRPIQLQIEDVSTGVWSGFAQAQKLPTPEQYFAENGDEIRFHIKPDLKRGLLLVEVGNGNWLRYAAPRPAGGLPSATGPLPSVERIRWTGKNTWGQLLVLPVAYDAPTVSKSPRYFGPEGLDNWQNAQVAVNILGSTDSPQDVTPNLYNDGNGSLSYDVQATTQDDNTPPRFSDILIYIPPLWGGELAGLPIGYSPLRAVQCRELQVWDDAARMGTTSARIICNNADGSYVGTLGNYAIDLSAGNGVTFAKRLQGVIAGDPDGIVLTRQDPYRFCEVPCRDNFVKMNVPLRQEVVLDGIALPAAVRLLAMIGNIHPRYLQTIPDVGLPPSGGYGDDFPYYILGKGMGANPKYRFLPDRTVLSVLAELIQDSTDPYTNAPYFMYFDIYGQFHFEPYNPANNYPVGVYTSFTPGLNSIYELKVYNSVAQMRTDIVLQGQDAFTYELMQYNLPLPGNIGAVGYRFAAMERNERWATPAYMQSLARIAAYQASLGTQVVRMRVPFNPTVYAGQNILIMDDRALGRSGLFTILEIDSVYGVANPACNDGAMVCESWITARNIESSIPVV